MSEIRRLIQWGMVLTLLTLVAIVIGAFLLYQEGFQAERRALEDTVTTQAALIEAVAAFDRVTSPEWHGDDTQPFAHGASAATLSQVEAAFAASPGLGETGELVVGRQEDGEIVIFLHQRAETHVHQRPEMEAPPGSGISDSVRREHAHDVNESSTAAEPMRRALAGQSGTVIAEDYLHKTVLAAYQPLESLGWGLVAKKDLAEIRAPFIRSAAVAAVIGGVLVLIGGLLFRRATDPLISRLRRSEARYAQLLEQAGEAIIVLDAHDRILIVNTKAAEIFGVSRHAVIGQSAHDFIPEDFNRRIGEVRAARESGQAEQYEYTLCRGAETRRLRISASPLLGPRGEYEGRMALAADITTEYRERQAHDRERRLLRTVLDTLPVGVWVLDTRGRFVLHNPAGKRIWGVEDWSQLDINQRLESFQGWDLETGRPLAGEDWGAVRALRGEDVEPHAIEIAAFDGQRRVILQSAVPLRDEDGVVGRALVVVQDITDAHARQMDLNRERRLLASILEHLPVGVGVMDREGRWQRSNPELERIWELDGGDFPSIRGTARWSKSGEFLAPGEWPVEQSLQKNEPQLARRLDIEGSTGERRSLIESAIPLSLEGDETAGVLVVDEDITQQESMQRRLERNEALLSLVLENLPAGVSVADEQGRIILGNAVDADIWGTSRLGQNARDYRRWARRPGAGEPVGEQEWPVSQALEAPHDTVIDQVFEIEDAAGETHTLKISAAPILNADEYWGAVELTQDITAERVLQKRMRRLSEAVEAAGEAILVLDMAGRIEYANPAFVDVTGYSVEEARGESVEGLLDAGRQSETFYRDLWARLRGGEKARSVIVNRRRDGHLFHWDMTLSPLMDGFGGLMNVVVTARDITEKHEAEEALYRATREDLLTGLPNDLAFREALGDRLQRIDRGQRSMALALVDLRGFSHLNDALGRKVGDEILREQADRLRGVVRQGDLVARLGSDTFAILYADLGREEDLPWVVEKLEKALDAPYTPGKGEPIVVPHYIGVARAPKDARDADLFLALAHSALDAAKKDPVRNLRYYSSEYGHRAMRQLSLEGALRKALAQDALELYFQPQIDLADGRLRSMETLLRWDDPELGPISPAEFIPLAEQVGLVGAIDDWVLEHAVAMQAEWRRMHRSTWVLALNLSGARIADPDLPTKVAAVLERSGSAPADLEIEVTETAAMQGSGVERRNLAALREMGVSVAIDDFGTGYSSMAQLARLPADVLKIDRSFVDGLGRDETSTDVVRTILSLAHSMQLEVIAEGVETRDQLAFLTHEGCEFGQGFLLARPMPASEMLKNLGRESWLPGNEAH
ncbi:EAL domain-containing protein [Guyparkeria sp. 1SP6A2]|nr:EAL domain-containing protein [Guyparkeria sp. 1SP6A2]